MSDHPLDTNTNAWGGHDSASLQKIADECRTQGISAAQVLYEQDKANGPTRSAIADILNGQQS